MGEQPDRLDRIAHSPPQILGLEMRDVLAVDPERSVGPLDQPVDHPEGRRLARAGGTDQGAELALGDRQGEIVDRGPAVEPFADPVELDHAADPWRWETRSRNSRSTTTAIRMVGRSEERSGGTECVSTGRSRWSPLH